MSTLNLKLLQIFITVAEEGSFRKAAEIVHRSQSAVSMQVKQAEDQLGVTLFHRTTRRVQLTTEGEMLLSYAKRALAELESGLRTIKGAVNMQSGQLTLGCVPSVSSSILPTLIKDFSSDYPGIKIILRELASDDLLAAIAKQDVELGIGPVVEKASDFHFRHAANDPIYALMPAELGERYPSQIALRALATMPIIMHSTSAALRRTVERELTIHGLELDIRFEILHAQTLVAFTRAGLGVAVLPKVVIPTKLGSRLHAVPIVEPDLSRELAIVTLRGQALSPAAQRLADLAASKLKSAADR